jgi:excisionase family DNA binding protein
MDQRNRHNYSGSGIVVHMSEDMSAQEVAAHLGVSNRRIRALIASGQLPARQVAGRWMVPAGAVSGFLPKDGGRPMAEHSAWSVLASLAGEDVRVPSRLRNRVEQLESIPSPHLRLRAWMSARGHLHRLWAFRPVIDDLVDDDRLILGGEYGGRSLAPSDHLHAYVSAADFDHLVNDYGLRAPSEGKRPNVFLWAVADLDRVPRRPDNPRVAAPVVSAVDLLDDGDPRAVGEATDIIAGAVAA